jgi:succinate-semialdehyde dehydrogenase/glutarate-semialdehyde dehydrogenase
MTMQIVKPVQYQSVNPATGEVLKQFPTLTDKELEAKIATAQKCFETWRNKTYAQRAVIVARAAELLHAQAAEFAHTMTLEMGKRIGEARGEVEFSSDILSYYAKNAERFLAPVKLHPSLGACVTNRQPGPRQGARIWYAHQDLPAIRPGQPPADAAVAA